MKALKRQGRQEKVSTLVLLAPAAASLLAIQANNALILDIAKYLAFYIFIVIPIAYCAGRLFLGKYNVDKLEALMLGYPVAVLGMAATFGVSKFLDLTWLNWILPVAAYICVALQIGRPQFIMPISWGPNKSTYLKIAGIYTISALILFFTYTTTTHIPNEEAGSNIYEDTLWTIGNTWSLLKNGLPLVDLRFDGVQLGYHIGQNLYYAYISIITGIDPIALHLHIGPFYDLFFLVSAIVIGSKIFLEVSEGFEWIVAIPILFCVVEITSFKAGGSPEFHEIYTNPISLAFGLSSFILMVMILSRRYNNQKDSLSIPHTYLLLLFCLSVSCKGIIGILIPVTIIAICTVGYVLKRIPIKFKDLQLIAFMLLIVLALRLTIFSGSGGWIVTPQIEVSPVALEIARKVGLEEVTRSLYFIIGPISRGIRFLFHTLIWNWVSVPIILILIASAFRGNKAKINTKVLSFGIFFAGVCSFIYGINIIDNYWANLYFYKYTFAILTVQLGVCISHLTKNLTTENQPSNKLPQIILVICALNTSAMSLFNVVKELGSAGWKINREQIPSDRPTNFLSKAEHEALTWMKNNISPEAIIASDRKNKIGWSGNYIVSAWFNYTAFSGLQFYNEGDAFNVYAVRKVAKERWQNIMILLDSKSKSAASASWKNIKADYLILSKRISPESYRRSNLLGTEVYKNGEIKVIAKPK